VVDVDVVVVVVLADPPPEFDPELAGADEAEPPEPAVPPELLGTGGGLPLPAPPAAEAATGVTLGRGDIAAVRTTSGRRCSAAIAAD
jgi:hypothetical protein